MTNTTTANTMTTLTARIETEYAEAIALEKLFISRKGDAFLKLHYIPTGNIMQYTKIIITRQNGIKDIKFSVGDNEDYSCDELDPVRDELYKFIGRIKQLVNNT